MRLFMSFSLRFVVVTYVRRRVTSLLRGFINSTWVADAFDGSCILMRSKMLDFSSTHANGCHKYRSRIGIASGFRGRVT